MDLIENLIAQTIKELEIRTSLELVILNDPTTREKIEDFLESRFFRKTELTKRETETVLNEIITEIVDKRVREIFDNRNIIKDFVTDPRLNHMQFVKATRMKIQDILNDKTNLNDNKLEIKARGKGRALPQWIINLKKGHYTVRELMEISGTDARNVRKMMTKYCKNISYIDAGDHLKKCVYQWEGVK